MKNAKKKVNNAKQIRLSWSANKNKKSNFSFFKNRITY